jgi:hypothetical protein
VSAPLGYESLCQMAQDLGRPQGTLTVLSHGADPFGVGTPAHIAKAEWFAALWREHMPARGGHLRRLHYRLVVQPSPIAMIGGGAYENTTNCWATLKVAGKWARYLGLIDADDLDDKRPIDRRLGLLEYGQTTIAPATVEVIKPSYFWPGIHISEPSLPELPQLILNLPQRPRVPQRYHVEIWVEKTDVEDVIKPLVWEWGLNYIAFAGQPGIKPCRELVERAERSGRPVRLFYISDFDPQGESMPIAVARKVEFVLAERGLDLDIQVIPLALTKQQCIDLKLPRAPIKEKDRGKNKFEERHGEGATELDALEALHPGLLRDLILTELRRYHDPTLDDRVDAAFHEAFQPLSDEVEALNNSVVPGYDDEIAELRDGLREITEALTPIREQLAPIRKQAEAWCARAERVYQAIADELEEAAPEPPAEIECPKPADGDEHPDPLFDSRRSYVEQIEVYKRHQGKPTERRERRDKGRRHGRGNGGAP